MATEHEKKTIPQKRMKLSELDRRQMEAQESHEKARDRERAAAGRIKPVREK